jgi:hypothetical protein
MLVELTRWSPPGHGARSVPPGLRQGAVAGDSLPVREQAGCAGWTAGTLVTHVIAATTMYAALLDGATAAEAMCKLASVTTWPVGAASGFRQAARAVQTRLSNPGLVTRTAHHPAGDVTCCDLAGYAMVEWVLSTLRMCGLVVLATLEHVPDRGCWRPRCQTMGTMQLVNTT